MIGTILLWRCDVLEKPDFVCVQSLLILVFNVGVATIDFASHGQAHIGFETFELDYFDA
jgi:hypothetical protein